MRTIYLDQNHWIELARAEAGKSTPDVVEVLARLTQGVASNTLVVPLSEAHVIETSKRDDPQSRLDLAKLQARLSRGTVLRSRRGRIMIEARLALEKAFGQAAAEPIAPTIVTGLFRVFDQLDPLPTPAVSDLVRMIDDNLEPQTQVEDFLSHRDDMARRQGLAALLPGLDAVLTQIEGRRTRLKAYSREMQSRAYAAQLFLDHQDIIIRQLESMGKTPDDLRLLGDEAVGHLVTDIPTLHTERVLAMRLESQGSLQLNKNHFFDMYAMCAAVPYCTDVVGENLFINLARQCQLNVRHGTKLLTKLAELRL